MTKNQSQKSATVEVAPASETAPSRHISVLQGAMDDLTARLADNPKTSLAVRAARAAKAGIAQETVETVFATVEAAVADARAAYTRALNAPRTKSGPVVVPSRINLLG